MREYGAVGDGVHDDTPAFLAAIAAAVAHGGGTVYAPSATYKITAPLTAAGATNVNFLGDGAYLNVAGNGTVIQYYLSSTETLLDFHSFSFGNNWVEGIAFVDANFGVTTATTITLAPGGSPNVLRGVKRCTFNGCAKPIVVYGQGICRIEDNNFIRCIAGTGQHGIISFISSAIGATAPLDSKVVNNFFYSCTANDAASSALISVEANTNRVWIEGNTTGASAPTGSVNNGVTLSGTSDYCTVVNNFFGDATTVINNTATGTHNVITSDLTFTTLSGGGSGAVQHVSASYAMKSTDAMVIGDASAGDITITLPTSPVVGQRYRIEAKMCAPQNTGGVGAVLIAGTGILGELAAADGAYAWPSEQITLPSQINTYVYDGTTWWRERHWEDCINVMRDFGARNDSITDDRARINAALHICGYFPSTASVYLPSSGGLRYVVSDFLTVSQLTRLHGDGPATSGFYGSCLIFSALTNTALHETTGRLMEISNLYVITPNAAAFDVIVPGDQVQVISHCVILGSLSVGYRLQNCLVLANNSTATPHGCAVYVPFTADVTISDCVIAAPNAGANPAIKIAAGITNITVRGCADGGNASTIGIDILAGAGDYLCIADNDFHNATVAGVQNGATGAHNVIRGNSKYNPVGYLPSQPAVPASGTPLVNTSGVDWTLYIDTIGNLTAVAIGGTSAGFTPLAGSMYVVPAGQSITFTYGVTAPTIAVFGS